MCRYDAIIGNGDVVGAQLLTLVAIALSILFWLHAYRKAGIRLRPFTVPIVLWIFWGTLDIVITARAAILNPSCEGNLFARTIFGVFGYYGPAFASIAWISFWCGLVFLLNTRRVPARGILSLAVFYGLAIGHFFGFSSWYGPLCWVGYDLSVLPAIAYWSGIVIIGLILAVLHAVIATALAPMPVLVEERIKPQIVVVERKAKPGKRAKKRRRVKK